MQKTIDQKVLSFWRCNIAKRFTDSRKWDDDWFLELPARYKLLWLYILDKCDYTGFFKPNLKLANFCLDTQYSHKEVLEVFKDRVYIVGSKWHIPKFIEFQYGELTPNNNTHISIINRLIKAGVRQGLPSPFVGVKDKDKDKDKRGIVKGEFEEIWQAYPNKVGKKEAERHFNASIKTPQDLQDIKKALQHYLESKRVYKGFIMNGSTFMNQWRDWVDFTEPICVKCKGKGEYTSTTGYKVTCDCIDGKNK